MIWAGFNNLPAFRILEMGFNDYLARIIMLGFKYKIAELTVIGHLSIFSTNKLPVPRKNDLNRNLKTRARAEKTES